VVGPTGSGKTALAVALAKKFNGVVISADSRQVYRGLDVGTNKEGQPGDWLGQPARFIDGVPQLLIDIAEPGEHFTLHDWLEQAKVVINLVVSQGQLPIIAGGTGLYVTALLEGYQPGEGRYAKAKTPNNWKTLVISPATDRGTLYQRSDERYPKIFEPLVSETKRLLASGVSLEWLESIGLDYRYAAYFIEGERNRELAIEEFQRASRAYIRRQQTWWRHHGPVKPVASTQEAVEKVQQFLRRSEKLVM
jgi:tRNA A37 N6-isopentenylltransferase MiaA